MKSLIRPALRKKMIIEIKKYIELLIYRYENNLLNNDEIQYILLICSEALDKVYLEEYQKQIKHIIISILNDIKLELYDNNNIFINGMFDGFGHIAFSLDILNRKTGAFKQFSQFFNQCLLDFSEKNIIKLKKEILKTTNYDLIYGISGVLYYLLDCKNIQNEDNEKIYNIIKYLEFLSKDHYYDKYKVVNFHINEHQFIQDYAKSFSDGYIDFGLAHGMIGCCLALSKAKYLGYQTDGLDEAIEKIYNLYNIFEIKCDGVLKYPTQLPVKDYVEGKINDISINCGWCYGNTGIVRGLMKVCNNIGLAEEYIYYKEELINIINSPIESYNLNVPILCHGFASVLAIQISSYKETQDTNFLNSLERNILSLIETHKILNDSKIKNNIYDGFYKDYDKDFSILEGVGGVILTFMSIIDENINFMRLLMID